MKTLHTFSKSLLAVALLASVATANAQDHAQHQMPSSAAPAKKPVAKPLPKPAMKKKSAAKNPRVKPASKTPSQMDHSAMGHDMDAMKPAVKKTGSKASETPAAMDHSAMGHDMGGMKPAAKKTGSKASETPAAMDHSAMGHDMDAMKPAVKKADSKPSSKTRAAMDHSAMGHDMSTMPKEKPAQAVDHSAMGHDRDATQAPAQPMDHAAMGHDMPMSPSEPRTPIPPVSDADRAAAFPEIAPHEMQDNDIHSFVLLDRLEAWDADHGTGVEWEGQAWIGTDLNRLWLRSEGERLDGATEGADLEVLYGRSVARWWDVVAGIRHDFKPGASQDFAAIGVMGLAPQKFEVEATAYVGESGQTALRFEIERDLLLTNRLILQPLVEVNVYGKDDPQRGIGSGLSTLEGGLRMRYEITRKFAPYIGIVRERAFGDTADFRHAQGEHSDDTRFVAGLRIWF